MPVRSPISVITAFFWTRGFFYVLYALVIVSLLFPEFNPDLFWHLASGRKAFELGRPMLSWETFSFSKPGMFWINYEWLFEWIAYRLYRWGDYRLLVFFRVTLLAVVLWMMDRYLVLVISKKFDLRPKFLVLARFANFMMAYMFAVSRATLQPELFSLIFLPLFFILRDSWMERWMGRQGTSGSRVPIKESVFLGVLFTLWANLHGGFMMAFGVLGLQGIARLISMANAFYRKRVQGDFSHERDEKVDILAKEFSGLFALGLVGLAASMINPYGWRLYYVILKHLHDAPAIASIIQEWQPTQFYHSGSWAYWGLFAAVIVLLLAGGWFFRALDFESILLVIAFGTFASSHVRNTATFGVVALPVLWKSLLGVFNGKKQNVSPEETGGALLVESIASGDAPRLRWAFLAAVVGLAMGSGFFMVKQARYAARNIWMYQGIPASYVSLGDYPYFACRFLEQNPDLLRLKIMPEWGWGGLVVWLLHDRGARFYFDGRYLFHDLLLESVKVAEDPAQWSDFMTKKGIEACILRHPRVDEYQPLRLPRRQGAGYDQLHRSWHSQAYPKAQWAQVWWDQEAMVLVRRNAVDASWLKRLEYDIPINTDFIWVEFMVKKGLIQIPAVEKELRRNVHEAGLNVRNGAYLHALEEWKKGRYLTFASKGVS
ncbi:MAG: hypothetical protein HY547_10065 [Elusimicrobia bacterium]|nr:hypothetical protein [Elusimicrobiota bacterium]